MKRKNYSKVNVNAYGEFGLYENKKRRKNRSAEAQNQTVNKSRLCRTKYIGYSRTSTEIG